MSKPHALIIPFPLQGHVTPTLHLALRLASSNISVTFVNTESFHHRILSADPDSLSGFRASGIDIRYETISDGLPVEFDRSLYDDEFGESLLKNMEVHVEGLLRRLVEGGVRITCLIADTLFVWPSRVAKRFGIPYVSFWTEPALVFALYYHMDLLKEHGHFASPSGKNRADKITYIPGVDALEPSDLTSYLQDTDTSSISHQIIPKAFEAVRDADLILCNTIQELETNTISALNLEKPFSAIGPIFPQGFTKSKIATSLWTESDCTQWLDSKPLGSVLYVSFGSYAHISKKELQEIAYGVMDSNVNFLWVSRPDVVSTNEPDPLPKGFVEEARDRGKVVTWCCQIKVLTHQAVGGFLTHCGWNSVLDSIWSRVPLLCFPLLTDQYTNRKLVVKDWKIGIDLGGAGTNVSRKEVLEKVNRLMMEEEGNEMKMRIEEVRRQLESAVTPNGSSQRAFDRFLEHLMNWKGAV